MEKIAVFSLTTSKPQLMTAIMADGTLVIKSVKKVASSPIEQRQKLPPAISQLRKSGFKVLVDELTPNVSAGTGASQVTLKMRHADGRAAIIVGIERYRELKQRGLLLLPKENKGAYELPDSIIDIEYNGNGEEVYRINWTDLRPEHVLVILCAFATVYHDVSSADYVKRMEGVSPSDDAPGPLHSFMNLIAHRINKAGSVHQKSLCGKKIDDDTVVL